MIYMIVVEAKFCHLASSNYLLYVFPVCWGCAARFCRANIMFNEASCTVFFGIFVFAAGGGLQADYDTFMFCAKDDDGCQLLLKRQLLWLPGDGLNQGCRCRRYLLLLTTSARIGAKLVSAPREKSVQAIVLCDWSLLILHSWLATDGNFEDESCLLVAMNLVKVEFIAITGGDLNFG